MGKLKVSFNDDGSAYVDTADLEAQLGSVLHQKEKNLLNYFNERERTQRNMAEAQEKDAAVQQILSKDEMYAKADEIRMDALTFLNERIVDFQHEHGLNGTVSTAQALTILERTGADEDFRDQYPNLNLLTILDSLNSPPQLEIALQEIANTLPDPKAKTPQGIVSNNTASDLLEMSDDDIDALLNQLADEEINDGISW